jgi:ABC-type transport system involved in multi-copper enzyme maturation permease subunit
MTAPLRASRAAAVLAVGTLLEALRSRLLWVTVVFAVVLVGMSVSAASVAIYERARLIVDVGLAAASGLGSLIAAAATITFFAGELRARTAYPVLARPLPRWSFVAGKFLGLWVAMLGVVAAMGVATAAVVWGFEGAIPDAFWPALFLTGIEMAVVVAVALLFASLSSPALAATYTAALLIAGNLSQDIGALAARQPTDEARAVFGFIYQSLPDLARLSLRTQAANNLPVPGSYVALGTTYGLLYAACALGVSMVIFSRREAM